MDDSPTRIGLRRRRRRHARHLTCVAALCLASAIIEHASPRASWGQTANPAVAAGASNSSASDGRSEDSQFVHVGVDDRVTMHVSDLPLADALRTLTEPTRRNIILAKGVEGTVTASLYDVTFEEALQAMLVSNGLIYRMEGDFIFVYPEEDSVKLDLADRKIETRVYRLSYMNAAAVKGLIEPLLSEAGTIAVTPPSKIGLTGGTGAEDSGGSSGGTTKQTEGDAVAGMDTLVITDYVEALDELERVIMQLDVRPRQVLIEATILRATLNENNALGIDFTTVGGVDFGEVNSVSPAAQSITTGNIPQALLGNTNFTVRTDFNSDVRNGGFTFGIIKDQIGVFIRALEEITDTNVLANPKVLALNKQFGEIIVGRRDGFITTTITATTTAQTIEFLETGTILTFRPFIGDDGYVRMEVHPKDSTGGLTEANLPFEQTTEVTSNIMVKDGRTILIGGLFREVGTATRGQVPLLGDLPIAGGLFRNTSDNTVREEVIILLTVHIVKDDDIDNASKELKEDVERYRVGMRKGMQWFGRERLAQAHYRAALGHLAHGDTDKALWDARMAQHNYPRHIHAALLIEKLQGERDWDSEASAIRAFIDDRIKAEQGIKSPNFGRPGPPFTVPEALPAAPNDAAALETNEARQKPSERPASENGGEG